MASITISVPVSDATGAHMVATVAATTTAAASSQFPNAASTGVLGGTTGMAQQASGGSSITTSVSNKSYSVPITVNASNITIDHCFFAAGLHLKGSNITVQNCYAKGSIVNTTGFVSLEGNGCKLLNSEVDGGTAQVSQDGIWMGSNTAVQGCNIHGWSKGVYCGGSNLTITGNYMWGIVSTGEHTENVFIDGQGSGTQSGILISGNNINCNVVPNVNNAGPIFVKNDFGSVNGVTIDKNLLVGGGFSVFACLNAGVGVSGVKVTNNVLGKGVYGYAYASNGYGTNGHVWSGNVDQVTGKPVS